MYPGLRAAPATRSPSPGPPQGAGVLSCCGLGLYNLLRVTPTAKRNTYSIATPYYICTQGSVLRPQPWAGKTQLHYLSAAHCAAPVTFGSELLLPADISTMYQPPPLPHHGHHTSHEHHSSLTQGERGPPNRLKHNKYDLHHFGEGWGGASSVWSPPKKGPNFPNTIWRGGRSLGHG